MEDTKLMTKLTKEMIAYNDGDPKRIQHFLKVHSFAALIGREEGLDPHTQFILETAALVHDIGIRPAEVKYDGRCNGKLQEQEGPAPARKMLSRLGFEEDLIKRVCYLVGHHHTYVDVDGMDYQILLEADFLVNLYEDDLPESSIRKAAEQIFRTKTGIWILKTMFLPEECHE